MKVFKSLDDPGLAQLLIRGAVGIIPTDTIYGLAAAAANAESVARLYALKSREQKPGTVIAADTGQLAGLGLDKAGLEAVGHHWPNPVSIVMDSGPEYGYLHQGVGSLAVRIPGDAALNRLLRRTGPLVTTSANHPGKAPANDLTEAMEYFGSSVDFYADGGDRSGRPPSTVARYAVGKLTVLRQGAVKLGGD